MNESGNRKSRATWYEMAIIAAVGVTPSLTLLVGDKNGLGFFQQPRGHNLLYAVVAADILNLAYVFLVGLILVPWVLRSRRFVSGALILLGGGACHILIKAVVDVGLIHIWYPDLIEIPFRLHLIENSYFAFYGAILGVGYGSLRRVLIQPRDRTPRRAHEDPMIDLGSRLNRQRFVLSEIRSIKAEGNYVKIDAGTRSELVHSSLNGLYAKLPQPPFVRVHRSYIVNLQYLERSDTRSVTIAGQAVPMSRSGRQSLDALMGASDRHAPPGVR